MTIAIVSYSTDASIRGLYRPVFGKTLMPYVRAHMKKKQLWGIHTIDPLLTTTWDVAIWITERIPIHILEVQRVLVRSTHIKNSLNKISKLTNTVRRT